MSCTQRASVRTRTPGRCRTALRTELPCVSPSPRVSCRMHQVRPTILEPAFGETTGQVGTMFVQTWQESGPPRLSGTKLPASSNVDPHASLKVVTARTVTLWPGATPAREEGPQALHPGPP